MAFTFKDKIQILRLLTVLFVVVASVSCIARPWIFEFRRFYFFISSECIHQEQENDNSTIQQEEAASDTSTLTRITKIMDQIASQFSLEEVPNAAVIANRYGEANLRAYFTQEELKSEQFRVLVTAQVDKMYVKRWSWFNTETYALDLIVTPEQEAFVIGFHDREKPAIEASRKEMRSVANAVHEALNDEFPEKCVLFRELSVRPGILAP